MSFKKKTCATNTEEKIIDLNKFVLQSSIIISFILFLMDYFK